MKKLAERFDRLGCWFEDAVWAEARPNLPRPFFRVAEWCWWVQEKLEPRPAPFEPLTASTNWTADSPPTKVREPASPS
jgi:hypothetical protein